MSAFDYMNATGVVVPDTANIKAEVVAEYRAAFGQDMVDDDETPQGTLIVAETLARSGVVRLGAAIANQINPRQSGGIFLDSLCAFLGLVRTPPRPSVNRQVLLTGAVNTAIPAGAQARDESGNLWVLQTGVTIGSDNAAIGVFVCATAGPTACPAGSMNRIVTAVLGWETVRNTTDAELGAAEQSDESLRALREVTLARQGISFGEAITSNLYDPTVGVRSLAFRENVTNETVVIDGVTLVPHSIWVCCDGGSDEGIASALLRTKTVGANWNGQVSVPTRDAYSGQVYPVRFARPTPVPVAVLVLVRRMQFQGDPGALVPGAVVNYAQNGIDNMRGFVLGPGVVSPAEIAVAIASQLPGLFIASVQARRLSSPSWQYDEVKFALDELPTVQASSVQVQVI